MTKARKYTADELKLFRNIKLTGKEIAKKLNISHITVSRTRQKLGISTPIGAKKGKPNIKKMRREIRVCENKNCKKEFEVIQSSNRKYCTIKCSSRQPRKYYPRPKRRNPNTPTYKRYARLVHGLSQKTYEKHINIINPKRHLRTICGIKGGWQLDHIIPVKECFKKGMSPQEAADVKNLRMLPWKENLMRYYAHH